MVGASFPRGRLNTDEKDLDCAICEGYEETDYDTRQASLIDEEHGTKYINATMREQHTRLAGFKRALEDVYFAQQTSEEISKIAWYNAQQAILLHLSHTRSDGTAGSLACNA